MPDDRKALEEELIRVHWDLLDDFLPWEAEDALRQRAAELSEMIGALSV